MQMDLVIILDIFDLISPCFLQAFKTWFEPIKPIKLDGNVLSVQVPSKFFYEWLEEHYIKILKSSLNKELGEDAKLVYIIRMENSFGSNNGKDQKAIKVINQIFLNE